MTEVVVVADAGPMIGLAAIDRLELLQQLFERVLVPPAVWSEATADMTAPGAAKVASASFIVVETPDESRVVELQLRIDRGEAEALALALRYESSLLLVDDRKARNVARELDLRFKGTAGLLVLAKRAGHLREIRTALDELRRHGLYLGDDVLQRALLDAGESDDRR